MAQYEMSLRDHWRIIRRRRWTIIVCSLLVGLFAFWFARQREPEYQSTSAIKFEQSTSLTGLLVEVLSFSPSDTIETQAAIVRSFPVMEQVAKRLGELPTTMPPEAVKESKAYTGVVDALAARVKTSRVASTNILEITTTSSDPRKAKDLANTVAEVYRDYNRSNRNARITEARKFIEAQVREVEGRVRKAEEEVWAAAPGHLEQAIPHLFPDVDLRHKAPDVRIVLGLSYQRLESHLPGLAGKGLLEQVVVVKLTGVHEECSGKAGSCRVVALRLRDLKENPQKYLSEARGPHCALLEPVIAQSLGRIEVAPRNKQPRESLSHLGQAGVRLQERLDRSHIPLPFNHRKLDLRAALLLDLVKEARDPGQAHIRRGHAVERVEEPPSLSRTSDPGSPKLRELPAPVPACEQLAGRRLQAILEQCSSLIGRHRFPCMLQPLKGVLDAACQRSCRVIGIAHGGDDRFEDGLEDRGGSKAVALG